MKRHWHRRSIFYKLFLGGMGACLGICIAYARQLSPHLTQANPSRFTIQDIQIDGICSAQPVVLDNGTVFGAWTVKGANGIRSKLVWYYDKTRVVEQSLPVGDEIVSCSPNGMAVGNRRASDNSSTEHILYWDRTRLIDLGSMNRPGAEASDINTKGSILGICYDRPRAAASPGETLRRASGFIWTDGSVRVLNELGAKYRPEIINNRNQIVGSWDTSPSPSDRELHTYGFVWEKNKIRDLGTLGGNSVHPFALNDRGQIVGNASTKSGLDHAFFWEAGRIHDLGTLGGKSSYAHALNNAGQIVGSSQFDTGESHAVLWQSGELIDLNRYITKGSQIRLNAAIDINEAGDILAVGSTEKRRRDEYSVLDADLHIYLLKNER